MMDREYASLQLLRNASVQDIEHKFIILYDGFGFPHC